MINRGDIKLAIDMVVNAQDDQLFGGEAEYVINTLEDCGNTIAAQAAAIEKLRDALAYCASDLRPEMQSRKVVATNALAIPTDSTQILDDVRRAEREKCAKVCDEIAVTAWPCDSRFGAAIRAME